jgi:hypothetical protein
MGSRSSFSNELRRTRQNNPDIGEFAGLCVGLNEKVNKEAYIMVHERTY